MGMKSTSLLYLRNCVRTDIRDCANPSQNTPTLAGLAGQAQANNSIAINSFSVPICIANESAAYFNHKEAEQLLLLVTSKNFFLRNFNMVKELLISVEMLHTPRFAVQSALSPKAREFEDKLQRDRGTTFKSSRWS